MKNKPLNQEKYSWSSLSISPRSWWHNLQTCCCFHSQITRLSLSFIHKSLIGHSPPYITSMLDWTTGPYQTRSTNCLMLQVPRVYSELGKSAFSFCAPNTWNYLQHILRIDTLTTPGQFKTMMSQCAIVFTECCPLLICLTLHISLYLDIIANEGNLNDFRGLKKGLNEWIKMFRELEFLPACRHHVDHDILRVSQCSARDSGTGTADYSVTMIKVTKESGFVHSTHSISLASLSLPPARRPVVEGKLIKLIKKDSRSGEQFCRIPVTSLYTPILV